MLHCQCGTGLPFLQTLKDLSTLHPTIPSTQELWSCKMLCVLADLLIAESSLGRVRLKEEKPTSSTSGPSSESEALYALNPIYSRD